MPVDVSHICSEGKRFDSLERSLDAINKTLAKLSELLISSATDDIRIKILEESVKDVAARVKVLESRADKAIWMERVVWAVVIAVVVGAFKYTG